MPQLYILIFAFVLIAGLVARRVFLVNRAEKKEFKEQVAAKVEENRKLEQIKGGVYIQVVCSIVHV